MCSFNRNINGPSKAHTFHSAFFRFTIAIYLHRRRNCICILIVCHIWHIHTTLSGTHSFYVVLCVFFSFSSNSPLMLYLCMFQLDIFAVFFLFYDQPFVRVFFFFVFSCVLAYDLLLEALYHPLAHLIRIIFTFCVCVCLLLLFFLSHVCARNAPS